MGLTRADRRQIDRAIRKAFQLGATAEREKIVYGLKTVASLNGSGAPVLRAVRKAADPDDHTPRDTRDTHDPHHLLLDAMYAAAEGGATDSQLHRLADLHDDPATFHEVTAGGDAPVRKSFAKAWAEHLHPRGKDGRFLKKADIAAAKSDPKKAAELRANVRPQDAEKLEDAIGGKTDLRNSRERAKDARGERRLSRDQKAKRAAEITTLAMHGEADAGHFAELADHLPHLTKEELRNARVKLDARFAAGKSPRRDQMVKALVAYSKGRAVVPKTPKKKRATTKIDSVVAAVRDHGGIDPSSLDLKRFYENSTRATQDGIPLAVFKRGGEGLDALAEELHGVGLIQVPEGKDKSEHLLDLLRARAHTTAADLSDRHEEALEDHYRALQEAADAGHDPDRIAESERVGREAGVSRAQAEGLDDDGGDAGHGEAAPEAEGVDSDGSFDFGANAEPGDTSGPEDPPEENTDPFAAAGADHRAAIAAITPGTLGYVAGHAVRRLPKGHQFQVETEKGYKTFGIGDADAHIRDSWRRAAGESSPANKALDRAAGFSEPDWFGGGAAADAVAKRKAAVPAGARAVSLDEKTRGRTGSVVRDPETGAAHLKLDGGETRAADFEPLESRFSWRTPESARPVRDRARPGDLFAPRTEDDGAPLTSPGDTRSTADRLDAELSPIDRAAFAGDLPTAASRTPAPPADDDHAREREAAADEKAARMGAWAADKPESLAAAGASAAAQKRLAGTRDTAAGQDGNKVSPPPDVATEPTTPVAAAVEAAQASAATPREVAEAAASAGSNDYEFARPSAIANLGEDLKGSARHTRNQWRGLEQAEKDGTAESLVTRDGLMKAEPPAFAATIQPHNALSHLVAHLALSGFPAEPTPRSMKGRDSTPEIEAARRAKYLDAYREVKAAAEAAAGESDPTAALRRVNRAYRDQIDKMRADPSGEYTRYNGAFRRTPGKDIADALVDAHNRTLPKNNPRNYGKLDVGGRLHDFAARVKEKYGDLTPDVLSKVGEHVTDVIEGDSFNKTFGTVKAGPKAFDPADAYVTHATRKGGRPIDAATVEAGSKYITDGLKMRGLQWGNSVTDDERGHHLQKSAEALADLADATGLPDQAVSLNGSLGLAIGARGKGKALAHYEPDSKVINLTRKNGVGSLAHEWGHALDHMLGGGGMVGGAGKQTADYLSADPRRGVSDPVRDAMAEVRNGFGSTGFKSRVGKYLNDKGMTTHDYWLSSPELFARSFETYVQHKLGQGDRENTYLAGGNGHELWPTADEIKAMAPAFDKLLAAVRDKHFGHLPPNAPAPARSNAQAAELHATTPPAKPTTGETPAEARKRGREGRARQRQEQQASRAAAVERRGAGGVLPAASGSTVPVTPPAASPHALTLAGMQDAATDRKVADIKAAYQTGDLHPDVRALGTKHGVQPAALRHLQREIAAGGVSDPDAVIADAVREVTGKTYKSGGKDRNYAPGDVAPHDVQRAAARHRAGGETGRETIEQQGERMMRDAINAPSNRPAVEAKPIPPSKQAAADAEHAAERVSYLERRLRQMDATARFGGESTAAKNERAKIEREIATHRKKIKPPG